MKIAFYINILAGGGAERVVSVLANQLYKNGHEVLVITSYSVNGEYVLDAGVERCNLDQYSVCTNRIMRNVQRILALRRILRKKKGMF